MLALALEGYASLLEQSLLPLVKVRQQDPLLLALGQRHLAVDNMLFDNCDVLLWGHVSTVTL